MGKIKQLSLQEAQKIAAGEVVERPTNVIKELIENSIDAGATHIQVYLEGGGKTLIRIIDNGSGMSPEDSQACFNHHATSKITSVNDLATLKSFGFRGEALASISAVSTVELITKEQHTQQGTKVTRENNNNIIEEVTCADGTDIAIHNLFYNVPARKKFLKTEQTEIRAITTLFQACCFDYPNLHLSLYSDNKQLYNCPAVKNIAERASQLWINQSQHLIPLEGAQDHARVSGLISNHQHFRYDRNQLFFFVNQRWIKNQNLAKALLKGYMNVIPQGRFPSAIIKVDIDAEQLDINIHPRKQDVEFLHPRLIEQLIQKGVKEALEANLSRYLKKPILIHTEEPQEQRFNYLRGSSQFFSEPFEHINNQISSDSKQNVALLEPRKPLPSYEYKKNDAQPEQETINTQEETEPLLRLIGQYKTTYILIEDEKGLCIIDQHAAHERILYEQFHKRFGYIATVNLLFPQLIKLSAQEYETIAPYLETIGQHGIQAESFGDNQLIVQATPVHLKNTSIHELINEIIGMIVENKHLFKDEFLKILHEKLHAQMACKAAVKAGDKLTQEQMNQIIFDLNKTENRFSCPHGRPTSWLLTSYELEKKFKRT
jgi:DNA mismatch repair protein MutL